MKKLEQILEWGGVKKDILLLVISGIALAKPLQRYPDKAEKCRPEQLCIRFGNFNRQRFLQTGQAVIVNSIA